MVFSSEINEDIKLFLNGKCLFLSIERDPTLKIKYSRKHPRYSDDGQHQQHKKHKISADAYAARSNELYECNITADISQQSEHGGQMSEGHSFSVKHLFNSKHGHHGSKSGRHHLSSSDKREQKKQVSGEW